MQRLKEGLRLFGLERFGVRCVDTRLVPDVGAFAPQPLHVHARGVVCIDKFAAKRRSRGQDFRLFQEPRRGSVTVARLQKGGQARHLPSPPHRLTLGLLLLGLLLLIFPLILPWNVPWGLAWRLLSGLG